MQKLALIAICAVTLAGCQTATKSTNPTVTIKQPTEKMMCTMQYDPVCGKIENKGVFSYKTYGNACTANNGDDNVVSYTQGACGAEK